MCNFQWFSEVAGVKINLLKVVTLKSEVVRVCIFLLLWGYALFYCILFMILTNLDWGIYNNVIYAFILNQESGKIRTNFEQEEFC